MMRAYALHLGVTEMPRLDRRRPAAQRRRLYRIAAARPRRDCGRPVCRLHRPRCAAQQPRSTTNGKTGASGYPATASCSPVEFTRGSFALDSAVAVSGGWRWQAAARRRDVVRAGLFFRAPDRRRARAHLERERIRIAPERRCPFGRPMVAALAAQLRRDRRCGRRDGAARMDQPPPRPQRYRPDRLDDARPRLRRGRALGL